MANRCHSAILAKGAKRWLELLRSDGCDESFAACGVKCTLRFTGTTHRQWIRRGTETIARNYRRHCAIVASRRIPIPDFAIPASAQGPHPAHSLAVSPALDRKEKQSSPSTLSVDCFHAWQQPQPHPFQHPSQPHPHTKKISGSSTILNFSGNTRASVPAPVPPLCTWTTSLGRSYQMSFHFFPPFFCFSIILLCSISFLRARTYAYISLSPIGDYVSGIEV